MQGKTNSELKILIDFTYLIKIQIDCNTFTSITNKFKNLEMKIRYKGKSRFKYIAMTKRC